MITTSGVSQGSEENKVEDTSVIWISSVLGRVLRFLFLDLEKELLVAVVVTSVGRRIKNNGKFIQTVIKSF